MRTPAVIVSAAALLVLGPVAAASAAPPPPGPTTLAEGLVSPLHVSGGPGKDVTVSQEFLGQLTTFDNWSSTTAYEAPGWDVSGSDYRGSTLFFLESQGAGPEDPRPLAGSLKSIHGRGTVSTVTDQIGAYETANNADGGVHYGLSAADVAAHPDCVAQLSTLGFPTSYTGEVDSHPYALTVAGNVAYVADAGMNAVLAVNLTTGAIRTVAVLPPRPAVITPEAATAFPIGACVGLTYVFEPVPTDVQVGPDGWLYVSSLPGGPEDASFGPRGAVFRVAPATGQLQVHVENLVTPTGLAFDGRGNLYIASLFGDGIFKVPAGSHTASLFLGAGMAADVDVNGSTLYATTNALVEDGGMLISLKL